MAFICGILKKAMQSKFPFMTEDDAFLKVFDAAIILLATNAFIFKAIAKALALDVKIETTEAERILSIEP